MNERAGRVRLDPAQARADVEAACRRHQLDAEVRLHPPERLNGAIERAAGEGFDAVVVGGGDGTLARAAASLDGGHAALGILPMGTLNLLARDLGIPLIPEEAIATIAEGQIRHIDVGQVNGQRFLMHASLGLHPWVVRRRDRTEPGSRFGKMARTVRTALKAVRHAPALEVSFFCRDERHEVRTRALVVTVGTVAGGLGPSWHRHAADSGVLALYASCDCDHAGTLRMLWHAASSPWHDADELEWWTSRELTVHAEHHPLPITLDGEIHALEPPLKFRVIPGTLPVLVPPS